MRLAFPALTIVFLFSAGSNGLPTATPFRNIPSYDSLALRRWIPLSSSGSSYLKASVGNDLSALLDEYKSSRSAYSSASQIVSPAASTVASPAAPTAVDSTLQPSVVDEVLAVTDAVSPPTSTGAENYMSSLSDAVSAATDAADQAAAAALAVATKATVASKAVAETAAATAVSTSKVTTAFPVKPLIGGVFVPVDQSKVAPADQGFDASANAREKLAILKSNFLGGIESFKAGIDSPPIDASSLPSFKAATAGAGAVAGASYASDMAPIVDNLHLKEYGGWYAAAAMGIAAIQQRSAGREDAASEFESELTQARTKANEAASAAGAAAEGARLAKELAMKIEMSSGKDGGQAILESSRLKQLQVEKEFMEKEVRALTAEVASLKRKLHKAENLNKPGKNVIKPVAATAGPRKVLMDRDPDEDARIIMLLKEMDEVNKSSKLKLREEQERKREAEAKRLAALKKEEERAALAKTKNASSKRKGGNKTDSKVTKEVEIVQVGAEATKKVKVANAPKGVTKRGTTGRKNVAQKAKRTSKRKTKKQATETVYEWSALSDSTLKRKTVIQLTEYLTERGVTVTDDSGKTLKKADLVEAVRSL